MAFWSDSSTWVRRGTAPPMARVHAMYDPRAWGGGTAPLGT
jgi:hypothetical protein